MSEPWSIRPPRAGDAAQMPAMLAAAYGELLRPYYSADRLRIAAPLISRPNRRPMASGRFYVADLDVRVIGCGGWSHEAPGTGKRERGLAHLRHFAVHPDHNGKGVGSAIIERCVEAARAEGVVDMECQATLMAETFYLHNGFDTVGFVDAPIGSVLFPCALMRRRIGPGSTPAGQ